MRYALTLFVMLALTSVTGFAVEFDGFADDEARVESCLADVDAKYAALANESCDVKADVASKWTCKYHGGPDCIPYYGHSACRNLAREKALEACLCRWSRSQCEFVSCY